MKKTAMLAFIILPFIGCGHSAVPEKDGGNLKADQAQASPGPTPPQGGSRVRPVNTTGVVDAAFSPDGKQLITCEIFGPVTLWDVAKQAKIWAEPIRMGPKSAQTVQFFADGKRVALGYGVGVPIALKPGPGIAIWDTERPKQLFTMGGEDELLHPLLIGPDQNSITTVAALNNNTAAFKIWSVADKAVSKQFKYEQYLFMSSWKYANDRNKLCMLSSGSNESAYEEFDISTGTKVVSVSLPRLYYLRFHPDGKRVIGISEPITKDGSWIRCICVYALNGPRELEVFGESKREYDQLGISPNGKVLIAAVHDQLHFWSLDPPREIKSFPLGEVTRVDCYVRVIAFSPDGKLAAVGGWTGRGIRRDSPFLCIFEVDSGKLAANLFFP